MKYSDNLQNNSPIGIFDSGVGGLTVYKTIREHLPAENMVYLGDTARIPYGTRSCSTIQRYALENAAFLMSCNIKLLVVACNTASSFALELLQTTLPIPVIGVIENGAISATEVTRSGRIGVIGTEATVNSQAYTKLINSYCPEATVIEQSCPLFVSLTEEGWIDHQVTKIVAEEYLISLVKQNIDTLVLGCTHYPILRQVIQKIVGQEVTLIDPAKSTAIEIKFLLEKHKALIDSNNIPTTHFCVTDSGSRFRRIAEIFLGQKIDSLETVDLWKNGETQLSTHATS